MDTTQPSLNNGAMERPQTAIKSVQVLSVNYFLPPWQWFYQFQVPLIRGNSATWGKAKSESWFSGLQNKEYHRVLMILKILCLLHTLSTT